MKVVTLTNAEWQIGLMWLREKMMFNPEPEGELLLEQLELAVTEESPAPLCSVKAPVISLAEWRGA